MTERTVEHQLLDLQYQLDSADAAKNQAYVERNKVLALVAHMAINLGIPVGIGQHQDKDGESWEDDWRNILFIDLPSGQVSWHLHDGEVRMFSFLPPYTKPWDGHSTDEKYQRVLEPGL